MRDRLIELQRQAPFICCPMCDEAECVGRDNCAEIKRFVESALRKEDEGK